MNVNQLFVGMHYVRKKLIRKNQNLLLNFGYVSLFSKSSSFLTACWLSIFVSTSGQRFQSPGVFRRKTENISVCKFGTSLHIFRSDGKLFHLDKQSERLDFQISKKSKYTCLITTSNARNNRRNDRSRFLEKLKQAILTK